MEFFGLEMITPFPPSGFFLSQKFTTKIYCFETKKICNEILWIGNDPPPPNFFQNNIKIWGTSTLLLWFIWEARWSLFWRLAWTIALRCLRMSVRKLSISLFSTKSLWTDNVGLFHKGKNKDSTFSCLQHLLIVDQTVNPKIAYITEWLLAFGTFVWLLSTVNHDVLSQSSSFTEWLSTLSTLRGFSPVWVRRWLLR